MRLRTVLNQVPMVAALAHRRRDHADRSRLPANLLRVDGLVEVARASSDASRDVELLNDAAHCLTSGVAHLLKQTGDRPFVELRGVALSELGLVFEAMYRKNPKIKTASVASQLEVSRQTVYNWKKELDKM